MVQLGLADPTHVEKDQKNFACEIQDGCLWFKTCDIEIITETPKANGISRMQ